MFKSFTPGTGATFIRNPHYWQSGLPYLDELQIVDFADPVTTRVNALTSGQIDGADQIAFNLATTVKGASNLNAIVSKAYSYHTWEMRMDLAPFNDVRVRQAMKLVANRPAIAEQAFDGSEFAVPGNDWPSLQDPLYDHSIPQRTQDIEQAKSLLKQAGRSDLTIPLAVSPLSPGAVATAQVFAQQAKAAGVTVNVNNITDTNTYFTKYWFQAPFKFDFFNTESVWEAIDFALLPTSTYNISKWHNPQWLKLVSEARGTTEPARSKELMAEAQKIFWDQGTQAIFAFYNTLDAYSTKFTGFETNAAGVGLNGLHFANVGLAA
jgi:peptide/nickel transport system substrate-binding protein